MAQSVAQLTEALRIKTKIVAEIKVASDLGQARREQIEASASTLANLTRTSLTGPAWKLRVRRNAKALLAAADRVLTQVGR